MKKILLSVLLVCLCVAVIAQDAKPTKEETYVYIQNLLYEVNGYTVSYVKGAIDRISTTSSYSYRELKNGGYYYEGFPVIKELGCNDKNYYDKIDFGKLIGEPETFEDEEIKQSSALKKLKLNFTPNSILKQKYGSCDNMHNELPVSHVILIYRNEDGVKERLVKAIFI